jgi:lysophospholipid acyltransferase (LPLAT)-like uncharacterized protein
VTVGASRHGISGARESDAALDSAFRRRWSWRTRLRVTVVGALLAGVLRLLYLTLRVRWSDAGDVVERHARGERFVFASWHDGIVLLPLVMVRTPFRLRMHPRVLLSWHRDAELAAQAARGFGVRFTRGSATRGGIGAVRGLLASHRAGDDLVIVPDGPRGPRREVKPGLVQLGRATGAPIVPIALAAAPRRQLGSWDRMQIPLPFAQVTIRFGPAVEAARGDADAHARVQAAMDLAVGEAERALAHVAR